MEETKGVVIVKPLRHLVDLGINYSGQILIGHSLISNIGLTIILVGLLLGAT